MSSPNQYHLTGGDVSVSWYPDGFGPIPAGTVGTGTLFYQDSFVHLRFDGDKIRKVDVPDIGTIVSVTTHLTVDTGSTTFSLIVPTVVLSAGHKTTPIQTYGIKTIHRLFLGALGLPQRESYSAIPLTGTAGDGPLPL